MASSVISKWLPAQTTVVWQAFTEPQALEQWQAPGEMTGKVHEFDLRVGGGYRMSVFYPESEPEGRGKTAGREDRYTARFVELEPPRRIVEAIVFESEDPAFGGEMTLTITLDAEGSGTLVTLRFENLPPGVRPEDNDAGSRSSLEKLARYLADAAR
jgi:uncharacterized protein YndB with AHSA1/START domain